MPPSAGSGTCGCRPTMPGSSTAPPSSSVVADAGVRPGRLALSSRDAVLAGASGTLSRSRSGLTRSAGRDRPPSRSGRTGRSATTSYAAGRAARTMSARPGRGSCARRRRSRVAGASLEPLARPSSTSVARLGERPRRPGSRRRPSVIWLQQQPADRSRPRRRATSTQRADRRPRAWIDRRQNVERAADGARGRPTRQAARVRQRMRGSMLSPRRPCSRRRARSARSRGSPGRARSWSAAAGRAR